MKAKRTIAGVLAMAMVVSAVGIAQVSAAGSAVTLKAAEVTAEAGGEFAVDISLTDIPSSKVNVLDFAVKFDSSVLTVDQVTVGPSASVDDSADSTAAELPLFNSEIQDGAVNVNWSTGAGSNCTISTEGVILTISGVVKDGVADGTVTPITFAGIDRPLYEGSTEMNTEICIGMVDGTNYEVYDVNTVAGSVTIGSKATTTEAPVTTTTTEAPDTTTEPKDTTTKASETTTQGPATTTSSGTTQDGGDVAAALYGDANCDGRVDITDAVHINKALAGAVNLNNQGYANSDVDLDGALSANDASGVLRFLVSLVDSLPLK